MFWPGRYARPPPLGMMVHVPCVCFSLFRPSVHCPDLHWDRLETLSHRVFVSGKAWCSPSSFFFRDFRDVLPGSAVHISLRINCMVTANTGRPVCGFGINSCTKWGELSLPIQDQGTPLHGFKSTSAALKSV